jgi:peptidyl-prolyl cis-trans isomerase SurA
LRALALLPLLAAPARADGVLVDGIAAQVGTDIVLYSEVMEMVAPNERRMRAAGAPESDVAKLRADGLETLIEWRLLEKVVRDAELYASDAEIDATIEVIARENNISVEELRRSVSSQEMTYQTYRDEIKRELERRRVVSAMVDPHIRVEEAEIKALYEERFADQPESGTTVHLRQILIPFGEEAGIRQEDACGLVTAMHKAVGEGRSFEELASRYSVAAPQQGGDIGWLHVDSMASWMVELIEPLEPGQMSPVASLPFACTIVQLVEKREWEPVSYEQAKLPLQAELLETKRAEEYYEWMEGLREGTFIERRGYFADAARFDRSPFESKEPEETSQFESGLEGFEVLGNPSEDQSAP